MVENREVPLKFLEESEQPHSSHWGYAIWGGSGYWRELKITWRSGQHFLLVAKPYVSPPPKKCSMKMSRTFPSLTHHVRQIAFDLKKFGRKRAALPPICIVELTSKISMKMGKVFPSLKNQAKSESDRKKALGRKTGSISAFRVFLNQTWKMSWRMRIQFWAAFPLCNLCFQKSILPKKLRCLKSDFQSCTEPPNLPEQWAL